MESGPSISVKELVNCLLKSSMLNLGGSVGLGVQPCECSSIALVAGVARGAMKSKAEINVPHTTAQARNCIVESENKIESVLSCADYVAGSREFQIPGRTNHKLYRRSSSMNRQALVRQTHSCKDALG